MGTKKEPSCLNSAVARQSSLDVRYDGVKESIVVSLTLDTCSESTGAAILDNLHTNIVIKENVCRNAERARSDSHDSNAAMSDGLYADIVIKKEFEGPQCTNTEQTCPDTHDTNAAMSDGWCTDIEIKKEFEGPQCTNTERACSDSTNDTKAMLDTLYTGHVIKDELVLGPENIQRPSICRGVAPGEAITRISSTPDSVPSNADDSDDATHNINTNTELLRGPQVPSESDVRTMCKALRCQTCHKIYTRSYALKKHIMQEHDGKYTIVKIYTCKLCQEHFTQHYKLKKHMRVYSKAHKLFHMKEKLYSCDICNKKFADMRRLESHKLTHLSKRHSCDVCHRVFRHALSLQSHKSTHTGEKPFGCEQCDISFSGSRELKVHNLFTHADTTEKWDL